MTRFRWRLAAVASALTLATLALVAVPAATTFAVGTDQLTWTGTMWRDARCGTEQQAFDVRLYRHTQYEGETYRLCASFTNFCWPPFGADSSDALACSLGLPNDTLNDKASSIKVVAVNGGSSCRVRLHEHKDYGGGALTYWDPVWVPSLVPWPNDALSSVRRVC